MNKCFTRISEKISAKRIILFCLLTTLLPLSNKVMSQCRQLVWADEFNGTSLDLNNWSYETGNGCGTSAGCGWGNSEWEYYTNGTNNINVSGGNLQITAKYQPNYNGSGYNYTSGKINTRGKHSWLHGHMEARIKVPSAQRVWPAFWMLPNTNNWPRTGEIDILETKNRNPMAVNQTIHYWCTPCNNHQYTGVAYGKGVDFSADYHIYAVDWSPGKIQYSVDGVVTATYTPSSLTGGDASDWTFDAQNFYLIFNVAVGGNYTGTTPVASDYPVSMVVDYVRVYTNGTNCTNNPPSVNLTAPANNASYTAPANVTLSANASDSDGNIAKVDFYSNGALLGTSTAAPYNFTWTNVAAGTYSITAKATDNGGASTTSSAVSVTVNSSTGNSSNLTLNKPAYSSSNESSALTPNQAVDGNSATRWSSAFADPQWIYVDLGNTYNINRLKITWEAAYGKDYQIQVSNDAANWTTIKTVTGNTSTLNDWTSLSGSGRYVRIYGTARGTVYGYSIYELEVYSAGGTLIQAEDYSNMSGIQTQATSDAGGGLNVGWIDAGDWLSYYNVNFPSSGTYTVEYRVASLSGGGNLSCDLNAGSIQLGAIDVPSTGGWQNWTTITQTITVNAGTYNFGIFAHAGGWNLNWFRITKQGAAKMASSAITTDNVSESGLEVYPNPVNSSLTLKFDTDLTGEQIKIINASGVEVMNTISSGDAIDVSTLNAGIYMIVINKNGRLVSKRFVKN